MRRHPVSWLVLCQFCILLAIEGQAQLNPPHDDVANEIGCTSCHQMTSTYPKLLPPLFHTPTDIDDTLANNVCWSCHNDPMPLACRDCHVSTSAPLVLTHSSQTTSEQHGVWSVECWVCHNEHRQEQYIYNGSTYGKYIRRAINLENIKDDKGQRFKDKEGLFKTGLKSVVFKGQTGANSFADSDGNGNGVCQVCHTTTGHWSAAAPAGDKHFSAWACTECHDHTTSFKPGWPDHDAAVAKPPFCADCHSDTVFNLHGANDPTYVNYCVRCHQVNNNYQFTGSLPGVYLKSRLTKHEGKDKDVFTSTARCDDCHHGQFDEHVAKAGARHENAILGYDLNDDDSGDQVLACDGCHYPDLIQEHVTRRKLTCSVCHDRTGLGLAEVAAITNAVTDGIAGSRKIFCDDCHNDNHFLTDPDTSLIREHHYTPYSRSGDCTKCHVVGPGERGPHRPPCWYCHGSGKPGDPQRAGVDKHDQGPAITADAIKDFRACFSCHLAGSQGYVSGTTPLVKPMHGLPGTAPDFSNVYWPYGYYKNASNQWVASDPLIPTAANPEIPANLENDPARWSTWPGWHTLNYLGIKKNVHSSIYNDYTHPEVQDWARFGDTAIRYTVGSDFMRQDYPTVSINNGGTFEVPSFDGTGTVGKPTGSGSVSVNITPVTAVTAGGQWRLDGGPWQDSGDTFAPVTDRDDHLVEFKPLAGMDEPQPIKITVTSGQATLVDGTTATYTTCPDDTRLQVARTSGDASLDFSWTRPDQEETFQASGWRSGQVECEVWRENNGELIAAEGFATTTTEGGDACRLYKNGATPAGTYNLVLRVTGSTCFRNSLDLNMAVTVTAAGAPSPFGQAGGKITQPFLKSLALPTTSNQDFLHLGGNLYVHLNTDGVITTFTIDTTGKIITKLASTDLWAGNLTSTNTHTKMVRVSDTLIAISYKLNYYDSSNDSHIMTVGIEQNGSVIHTIQDHIFYSPSSAWFPRIYPHHDNSGLFIVTWALNDGAYRNGLLTVHISQSGIITEIARDMTMPGEWSEHGGVVHVAGDNYAFVRNKYIHMFKVSNTGAITVLNNPGSQYQYSPSGYYAEMIKVKGNIFAIAYSGSLYGNVPGQLKTITISDSGVISRTINTYMFQPTTSGTIQLLSISDNIVGVYYIGGDGNIHLTTIEITDDGRIMVPPLDDLAFPGRGGNPRLLLVGGDMYAFLVGEDRSGTPFFYGVKTYTISHDEDLDGIPNSMDNCSSQANAGQVDTDGDGVGDGCDVCAGSDDHLDADDDTVPDACDICAGHNDTIDSDGDAVPDGCDPCPGDAANDADNDGICAGSGFNAPKLGDGDNCPAAPNKDQADSDCDGLGNACDSGSVFFPPGSTSLTPLTSKWLTLSWGDAMQGEDGYRVEGKQGSCSDTTTSFGPLGTIYRHDRFDTGLDTTAWVATASIKSNSSTAFPASVSDVTNGAADVSWEDGKIKLHTVMTDIGEAGQYNSANIAINKFAQIIGDKDFDVQVDYELPNGAFFGDQYHVDVRLSFYFPDTDGKHNEAYLERRAGYYVAGLSVQGAYEAAAIATINESGSLRLVRKNRELAAYILDGDDWILVKKHSQPLTANLIPTWAGIVQYGQRNESDGGELTALVDNFKFNTVGSVPVAALELPMDEASWTGASGEVKDATAGNNHGTALGGAITAVDAQRGTVGSFDGLDDYVEVRGDGSMENVTEGSFTFAAWVRPDRVPPGTDTINYTDLRYAILTRPGVHMGLLYNKDGGGNGRFSLQFHNDLGTKYTLWDTGPEPSSPLQWYHVVGVVDDTAKTAKLYVNGELKGSLPNYTGNLRDYGTEPYRIGAARPGTSWTWFFDGLIDEAKVFDRALSDAEVTALAGNRLEYSIRGQSPDTTFCARVYPFKTNGCTNWFKHAAEGEATTLSSAAAQATTAGIATAVAIRGGAAIYVNAPYLNDIDADNTYTVEYKLSSSGTWTTHIAAAPHVASPFATKISGLTALEKYDVRVTYADPDGVNGTAQQVIANVVVEPGLSCLSILSNGGSTGDGVYTIDSDGVGPTAPYQAYCDMTTDGGGWTLAMKLDGSQSTFQYSANYWTTENTLNPTSTGFDTTQAKLQSFNAVPFSQVRLGMREYSNADDDIDWISINQSAASLVSLFKSGFIATAVGRGNWLNLLEGVNNQPYCNKEGFNAEQSYSRMRIGLAMNNENDCNTCDRILGFGNDPSGHPWGAWAVVGGGYPGSNTQAYGWIMVR